MILLLKRSFLHFLAAAVVFAGFLHTAQATMISTEQIARGAPVQSDRARMLAQLDRPEVVSQFEKYGLTKAEAKARISALTDEEVSKLAQHVDGAPAGGDGIVGAILLVFFVLLLTDILGLTKIFPFTRSVR
jgi:hypothetical protein